MTTLGWARSTPGVAEILRRGAWYPIVSESADGIVVLDVRGRPVRMSLHDLRVRRAPPEQWSVVVRTGVLRPTLGGQGQDVANRYLVCPRCQERQDFSGEPHDLKCPRCGGTAPVDWSETC